MHSIQRCFRVTRRYPARAQIVLCWLLAIGCSTQENAVTHAKDPKDAGRDAEPSDPPSVFGDGGFNPGVIDANGIDFPDASNDTTALLITPGDGTIMLDSTTPEPIAFEAKLSSGGASEVAVRWSTDHRDIGVIDPGTGAFKPNGAAGTIIVTAKAGSLTSSVTITVAIHAKQEGDPDSGSLPAGAGGIGGVGGEGGGSKLAKSPVRDALDKAATEDSELVWLYPYDGTVWPRGLPAPLLQWKHGAHAAEAVKLLIEVDTNYRVELYLGRPPGLAATQPISRLPIPQAIWRNALQSGAKMKVTLTIAASDGASGFATYTATHNPTWTIAPASLRGTVYYNSYLTKLVENVGGAKGGGRFGGATLAIRRDQFDPVLVAGTTTTDTSGCRVCHVIASNGSVLIAQHENNLVSSRYDLTDMNREIGYTAADKGKFGWAALTPDGTVALGSSGPPGTNAENTASLTASGLYRVTDGSVLNANGLSEFVTQAAMPTFSPDGRKVAFNLWAGAGNASIAANGRSLVVMDFAKVNDTTYSFANPKAVFTSNNADHAPGWPAFLPDGSGVVFELQVRPGDDNENFTTRREARGELWWSDLNGQAHALDRANGTSYLPSAPTGHLDDATLQYEPTVAPLVAGGYAWVVFTSRRLYGNVATRPPFQSDPRSEDLRPGNPNGPTTKKLWVAALDVPSKPGTDPSHPAFYLPAQELYAGNTRGYWVLDACKEDSAICSGGDECCGGYCRLDQESGMGICMDVPEDMCSREYDKCNVSADCCTDTRTQLYCIAGRCAMASLL